MTARFVRWTQKASLISEVSPGHGLSHTAASAARYDAMNGDNLHHLTSSTNRVWLVAPVKWNRP